MPIQSLSKTDYIKYLGCPEEWWMFYHQPKLMPPFSLDAQHKVEQGKIIDRLAQDWFKKKKVAGEVRFQYEVKAGNGIVKADVVVLREEKVCDIYEVKAATTSKMKEIHLEDIAYQRMVFEDAGYQVERTFLIRVNNKYAFQYPLQLDEFLVLDDVTEEVLSKMDDTRTLANHAWEWIHQKELPIPKTLPVPCDNKLNCPFIQHYFPSIPSYSIFDINNIKANKRNELLAQGIIDIRDVPSDFKLSDRQRSQVDLVQQNQIRIKSSEIKRMLKGLAYPLYFLDYETFSYVFPPQEGLTPYQQMVFQYSLHVIESEGSEVKHFEYLMPSKETPLENLIIHLQNNIAPTDGTVLVWNQGFEKSRNREMGILFPQYSEFLNSINERVHDLMKIFKDGLYSHPKFKGSASIKKVLPVLCPELSYGDLEIQNGNAAVIKWHHMTDGRMTEKEAKQTFQDLLKYCELDTWAMVRIWEELRKVSITN